MKPFVILDPGHGLGNRKAGVFDPGAVVGDVREADVAMDYTNELRAILRKKGVPVVRTRASNSDPCSISARARIAKQYGGTIMISFHCNAATGKAAGTETFYRGAANKPKAAAINIAVCEALGTRSRGAKTENDSQHGTLAVMNFQPCYLIELGFIDNFEDRAKLLDPDRRLAVCQALAAIII